MPSSDGIGASVDMGVDTSTWGEVDFSISANARAFMELLSDPFLAQALIARRTTHVWDWMTLRCCRCGAVEADVDRLGLDLCPGHPDAAGPWTSGLRWVHAR